MHYWLLCTAKAQEIRQLEGGDSVSGGYEKFKRGEKPLLENAYLMVGDSKVKLPYADYTKLTEVALQANHDFNLMVLDNTLQYAGLV